MQSINLGYGIVGKTINKIILDPQVHRFTKAGFGLITICSGNMLLQYHKQSNIADIGKTQILNTKTNINSTSIFPWWLGGQSLSKHSQYKNHSCYNCY